MPEPSPGPSGPAADTATLVVPADATSSSAARLFVREALARIGVAANEDLLLLTSEATANAVVHADTKVVAVSVARVDGSVRVSVHDDDPVLPTVGPDAPALAGGLGMRLIDQLADDWGVVEVEGDGKHVWFDLTI